MTALHHFAHRLRREPAFWSHHLTLAGIESYPAVAADAWTKLCCCKYPRPDHTDADLAVVSAGCGLAADVLRELYAACEGRRR